MQQNLSLVTTAIVRAIVRERL